MLGDSWKFGFVSSHIPIMYTDFIQRESYLNINKKDIVICNDML